MSINTKTGCIKEVNIREIEAKSILRKHKKIDSWFLSRYGMNLYQGCAHSCAYCDGRAEGYRIDDFDRDIVVKINALDILRRELDPKRKRVPMKRGYVMVGGGVGDSYQPVEREYRLTRGVLELLYEYKLPIHILTKSTLVERDIDIIKKINEQNRAIVSFSFSSTNDDISPIFEPGVPSPHKRLQTIQKFKSEGIACGMFLLPVIPFITDTPQAMENTIRMAKDAGINFIIFGGMTLKEGRQKDYFMNILSNHYPEIASKYGSIYKGSLYGEPIAGYSDYISKTFYSIIQKYDIPCRIPRALFQDILDENDRVIVILEHIDYFLRLRGIKSSFGYAAYSLSKINRPLIEMKGELRGVSGIGEKIEKVISEILETGTSSYYEELVRE